MSLSSPSRHSWLSLANSWADAAGTVIKKTDGRTMLPALAPNGKATLHLLVAAPAVTGRLQLIVNVVAEGNGWLDPSRPGVLRAEVTIAPRERMAP